jgi:hypothetical protein
VNRFGYTCGCRVTRDGEAFAGMCESDERGYSITHANAALDHVERMRVIDPDYQPDHLPREV